MILSVNPTLLDYKGPPAPLPHLSASSLSTYLNCGMQWRLQHVEKLELIAKPPVYFSFGSAFHRTLEPHWKGLSTDFKSIWTKYKDVPIDYLGSSWLEYYAKGSKMVTASVVATQGRFDPKTSKVEFSDDIDLGFIKVSRRVDIYTELNNLPVSVNGVIEKVSGPAILDLKTAGAKYADNAAAESQQLMTYALPNPKSDLRPRYFIYLVATKTNTPVIQLIGKKYTKDELKGQIGRYRQVSDLIHRSVFIQNKGSACQFCSFKNLCYEHTGWEGMYQHSSYRPWSGASNTSSDKQK